MNVQGLIQLCEAAQPAGGYSFSLGIDEMVRGGVLRNQAQLELIVREALEHAIGPADGVASGVTFLAARGGEFERIPEVCAVMSSNRVPVEMRLASLQMGERLWGLSRGWGWATGVHQLLDDLVERNDLHHAVAFGLLVSETTSSEVRAIAMYLYNTAKTIVMAAVRGVPLEEVQGMRVLSEVQPRIAELALACARKGVRDIGVASNP